MPRSEQDIPQPQESIKDRNRKAIEKLARFGGNLEKVANLVNGVVQEVTREQGLQDDIPFDLGLREEMVLGGRFGKSVSQNGIFAEAYVEVYKQMDRNSNGYKAEDNTRFFTNVGSNIFVLHGAERRYGGTARREGPQTWDLEELEANPEAMERFKRRSKEDFTQALENTRNAEDILAAEHERYEHILSAIENPIVDGFRYIPPSDDEQDSKPL